ncbi:MAG: transketolase [Myxococcota bacterium]|nr:transketolase [Myxococcota bacterium]
MSIEQQVVNTIKGLAMDAVQAANSGHPGAPMGMADIATVLWGRFLKYDPADPAWLDRDRVVLSNGHASMLLYSMLHLTGVQDAHRGGDSITLDDIKNFRQWGYPTAGHPEFGHAAGIETTTGPLGQGFANGVGMALAERWLRARFSDALVDHYTYVLTGDGCLMEGVAAEAASLAGHLKLDRMIVLYDDNEITIDGGTDVSFGEDVAGRFTSYGWQVLKCNGHDREAIAAAITAAKADTDKPTLICCRTVIADGSPNKAGTSKAHGAPLGDEEIRLTKSAIGLNPDETFAVPAEVIAYFRDGDTARAESHAAWSARHAASELGEKLTAFYSAPDLSGVAWPQFGTDGKLATRKASAAAVQAIAASVENLLGGSADLAGSNGSYIKGGGDITGSDFAQRNLHFGVREHGMAAICNGMSLHGGISPYCATFLVFHDYMRPSVRLSGLMGLPVTYVYTHDSIFLGEDGPTHQPVEHLMAMRGIPNLYVVRPADAAETVEAWKMALTRHSGPVALSLTRQGLPLLDHTTLGCASGLHKGGYVLSEADHGTPAAVIIATGSEVALALDAQAALSAEGVSVRVVSMPCCEAFEEQSAEYRRAVLPAGVPRVSVEAGITLGWERYVGLEGKAVGINRFGASAPASVLADKLGMNVAAVKSAVMAVLAE